LDRSVLLLITLGLPPDRNCAPNRNSSQPDSYGNKRFDGLYITSWHRNNADKRAASLAICPETAPK